MLLHPVSFQKINYSILVTLIDSLIAEFLVNGALLHALLCPVFVDRMILRTILVCVQYFFKLLMYSLNSSQMD